MIKLVNFKDGNLDCYGKSIRDFIKFLRDDILKQIRNCKNSNNYKEYIDFLNDLEEKIKLDDFIKKYFNHNRNERILKEREKNMEEVVELDGFSGYFFNKIFGNKFINFYLKDLLFKDDFESIREKCIDGIKGKKLCFDEILTEKEGNNKIYLEYRVGRDFIFICFFIHKKNKDIDEVKVFNDLQKYTKFIINNISNNDLLEFNINNYNYIKLKKDIFQKNINLESKGSSVKKLNRYKVENTISENIIKYLNDKLIKEIIFHKNFINFLESFIPSNK